MRSAAKPLAQVALLLVVGFGGLLLVEAAFDRFGPSSELLATVDLSLRAFMGTFAFLLTCFVVVNVVRYEKRRARQDQLSGLGAGAAYGCAALLLLLPFALSTAADNFEQRAPLDGRVYLLRASIALDGDGVLCIYECNALGLACAERASSPFVSNGSVADDLRLSANAAQHHVAVAYRGSYLFGYAPRRN